MPSARTLITFAFLAVTALAAPAPTEAPTQAPTTKIVDLPQALLAPLADNLHDGAFECETNHPKEAEATFCSFVSELAPRTAAASSSSSSSSSPGFAPAVATPQVLFRVEL